MGLGANNTFQLHSKHTNERNKLKKKTTNQTPKTHKNRKHTERLSRWKIQRLIMGSITKCLSTILHLKASSLYDWIMVPFRRSTFKTERYYTPSTYFLPQHYFWPYSLIQLSSLVPEFTSPKHLTLFSLSQSEFLCSGSVTENEACWIYTTKFPEVYQ